MSQVCFDSSAFYTVMIVGVGIIMYVLTMPIIKSHLDLNKRRNNRKNRWSVPTEVAHDLRNMHHPLTPPVRRNPYTVGIPMAPIGIPTRGEYGSFQQVGFLHNPNDQTQAMPLVGRRIHSNQYEYYTFHHNNPNIKIPIKLPGNKEINDGDNINVYGYTAPLQVKIYELDGPRYIPY
jgi:hypothetical protein